LRRRPPEPALNRLILLFVALAGLAVVIALLAVEFSDPEPEPTPTPTATPTPPPSPTASAVRGTVTTSNVLVDASRIVDRTDRPKPRKESIDKFVAEIRRELDNHLTSLGRGEGGTLAKIRAPRMPGIDPELTSELATPERWVVEAAYTFTVGHSGHPQWAEVTARLERSDGTTASPTLVFVVGNDRTPQLAAWEATITIPDLPTPTTSPDAPSPTSSRTGTT
jgi:hypothetical protein